MKPLGFPPRFGVLWLFLAPLVLFSGAGFLPLAIWFVVALSQAPELLLSCLRRERHGLVAQFEREMMLERQREGIAKAKSEARYKGRKPIEAERRHSVLKLAAEGATRVAIAAQIGIGEAAVYRIFAWIKPNPITERRFSLPDPRLLGALPVARTVSAILSSPPLPATILLGSAHVAERPVRFSRSTRSPSSP